ncbi:MAG: hypothetical protein KAS32_28805 [Candidatus Peribacteraceae bacterium]|nr:hypothetical protein [Candidatus Peribacteraceae bacterium]
MTKTVGNEKAVYCVTRRDLPTIHQAVQAGHACVDAGHLFRPPMDGCYLIYLHAENQDDLKQIMEELKEEAIRHTAFYEPDFNRGLTSIATEAIVRFSSETLSKLPLMEF